MIIYHQKNNFVGAQNWIPQSLQEIINIPFLNETNLLMNMFPKLKRQKSQIISHMKYT
jgi:hypothetical protein